MPGVAIQVPFRSTTWVPPLSTHARCAVDPARLIAHPVGEVGMHVRSVRCPLIQVRT
ncbi:MAG: hypothetical protein R2715_18385 [Ilumatobacteraceae bacterium]